MSVEIKETNSEAQQYWADILLLKDETGKPVEREIPFIQIDDSDLFETEEAKVQGLAGQMKALKQISGPVTGETREIPAGQIDPITLVLLPGESRYRVAHGFHRYEARKKLHLEDPASWPASVKAKIYTHNDLFPAGEVRMQMFKLLWDLRGQGIGEHAAVSLPRIIHFAQKTWGLHPFSDRITFLEALRFLVNEGKMTAETRLDADEKIELRKIFSNVEELWKLQFKTIIWELTQATNVDPEVVARTRGRRPGREYKDLGAAEYPKKIIELLSRDLPRPNQKFLHQPVAQRARDLKLRLPQMNELIQAAKGWLEQKLTKDEIVAKIEAWEPQKKDRQPTPSLKSRLRELESQLEELEKKLQIYRNLAGGITYVRFINYKLRHLLEIGLESQDGQGPDEETTQYLRKILYVIERVLEQAFPEEMGIIYQGEKEDAAGADKSLTVIDLLEE